MRFRMWYLVLALVPVTLGLEACGDNANVVGTIISKDGRDGHWNTWVSYGSQCVTSVSTSRRVRTGRNSYTTVTSSRCTRYTTVAVPHSSWIHGWWQVCVRADDTERIHCVSVPRDRWGAYAVGMRYPEGVMR